MSPARTLISESAGSMPSGVQVSVRSSVQVNVPGNGPVGSALMWTDRSARVRSVTASANSTVTGWATPTVAPSAGEIVARTPLVVVPVDSADAPPEPRTIAAIMVIASRTGRMLRMGGHPFRTWWTGDRPVYARMIIRSCPVRNPLILTSVRRSEWISGFSGDPAAYTFLHFEAVSAAPSRQLRQRRVVVEDRHQPADDPQPVLVGRPAQVHQIRRAEAHAAQAGGDRDGLQIDRARAHLEGDRDRAGPGAPQRRHIGGRGTQLARQEVRQLGGGRLVGGQPDRGQQPFGQRPHLSAVAVG